MWSPNLTIIKLGVTQLFKFTFDRPVYISTDTNVMFLAATVFSFCKMAGEQSIVLLASEFEGRGARITQKFLACFYCHIILSLGC